MSLRWYSLHCLLKKFFENLIFVFRIYQSIKLIFSICVMVSYPLQFFIPMERIEKWMTRKIPVENQSAYIYFARYGIVLLTCQLILDSFHIYIALSLYTSSNKFLAKIFELWIGWFLFRNKSIMFPRRF